MIGQTAGAYDAAARLCEIRLCCGCRRAFRLVSGGGVISFGERGHEPHCQDCCLDWEAQLKAYDAAAQHLTMMDYRLWQAERVRRA